MKDRQITAVFKRVATLGHLSSSYTLDKLTNTVSLESGKTEIFVGSVVSTNEVQSLIEAYPKATFQINAA